MPLSDIIPYVGLQEVKNIKKLLKEVIAEFLGTMFLVILGCGACIQPANQQPAIQQPYNHTTIPYNHTTMQPANPKPKIPIPPVPQCQRLLWDSTQFQNTDSLGKFFFSFSITTDIFILRKSLLQVFLFSSFNLVILKSSFYFIVTSSATDKKLEIDKNLEIKLEIYKNLEIKLEIYKNLENKLEIFEVFCQW